MNKKIKNKINNTLFTQNMYVESYNECDSWVWDKPRRIDTPLKSVIKLDLFIRDDKLSIPLQME